MAERDSSPVRICHAILRPRWSGAEVLACNLAQAQANRGHEVSLVAYEPIEESFRPMAVALRDQGVPIVAPRQPLGRTGRLAIYRRHFSRLSVELAFAHSILPSAYVRLATAYMKRKVPVASVLHDASQDDYANRRLNLVERFVVRPSDAVIAVAPRAMQNYLRRFPRFRGTTAVIPNGVPVDRIRAARSVRTRVRREAFGLADPDTRVILQIGRVSPVKRQHLTLAALAKIRRDSGQCMLVFVGIDEDREYRQRLMMDLKSSPVRDQVRWLGPRTDIYELLSAADVYVMPSAAEGSSVAYMEALASELPVVASDIDSFRFSTGMAGVYLCRPDCLDEYASILRALIRGDRKFYRRDIGAYDFTRTVAAYEAVIADLTDQPRDSADV